jgi:hypothetical protein
MDNRKLYYLFMLGMVLIWEMAKDILRLIFVLPFRILLATSLNFYDAVPFIRNEIHTYFNRLKIHGLTFRLIIRNGKPSVTVRSYDEETRLLSDEMNHRKYKGARKLIEASLLTVKKCIYVILQTDESGMKFIQFRHDGGTYFLDFPLTPLTLNRDYSGDIINLLRDRGFSKNNRVKGYAFKYKTYSVYGLSDEMTSISADFGNDLMLAVDTGCYIFEKIFKSGAAPRAEFG